MHQNNFSSYKKSTCFGTLHAFSLIEISVVIVIISLLIGGVTVGTNLYNNYKLMTIVGDAENMRMAIQNFKEQYQYYPGDFPRATAIWGATTSPTCNAASGTTSSTLVATTCDGNGDGVIGKSSSNMQELRERFFLWQHLNLAGYLNDAYSGFSTSASGNSYITPRVNVPGMKYSKDLGYTLYYEPTIYTTVSATRAIPVQGKLGHIFSWSTPGVGVAAASLITATDALKLDTKMDDGLPFSGNVFAEGQQVGDPNGVSGCTSGTDYVVSTTITCGQYYRNFLE